MTKVDAVEFTCGDCGAVNRLPREKILALKQSPLCGKCDRPLLRAFDRFFDDLDPSSYIHPLDKDTLEALKRIPGVSTLLRSLIRHSFELFTRLHHHANFVRIGPNQLPTMWARVRASRMPGRRCAARAGLSRARPGRLPSGSVGARLPPRARRACRSSWTT